MTNIEITLAALAILATVFLSSITIILYYLNLKLSDKMVGLNEKMAGLNEKSQYEKNRPQVTLDDFSLDANEAMIYGGSNTSLAEKYPLVKESNPAVKESNPADKESNPKQEDDYNYEKYIKDENRMNKNTALYHDYKPYMFINLHKKGTPISDVIFGLDVLNIKLSFSNNHFTRVRIIKAYSIRGDEYFGKNLRLNVEFPINSDSINVAIAYALTDIMSMHIYIISLNSKNRTKLKRKNKLIF